MNRLSMPISADQWRSVVGSNNVRRPRQAGRSHSLTLGTGLIQAVQSLLIYFFGACPNLLVTTPSSDVTPVIPPSVTHIYSFHSLWAVSMVTLLLLLLAGDVETNPGPGSILTKTDFRSVVNAVRGVRDKWYQLGLQLGMSTETLDRIKCTQQIPIICLRELLRQWLQTDSPTWEKLVDALNSEVIGRKDLAGRIMKNHHSQQDNKRAEDGLSEDERLADSLWVAVVENDSQRVLSLLREYADPNHPLYWTEKWRERNHKNWNWYYRPPPLHAACEKGFLNVVKILIQAGANKGVMDSEGLTPLNHACRGGGLELVQYLVAEVKCDVDVVDSKGDTHLHYACGSGQFEVVQYLVEEVKCDVDVVNSEGDTLLHCACWGGSLELVQYLVEEVKCDVGVQNNNRLSLLDCVLKYLENTDEGDVFTIAEYFINHGCGSDEEKGKLLCSACSWERLDVAKELIEQHKVNPIGPIDDLGRSPLYSVLLGLRDVEHAEPHFTFAMYLINLGCGSDEEKSMLLCEAYSKGRLDVVKELVEQHKLDPNEGKGKLLCKACFPGGNLDLVKELVEQHKIDPNYVRNDKGMSPLDNVLSGLNIAFDKDDSILYFNIAEYLLNLGCGNDEEKGRVLCQACRWGRLDLVKKLVEQHKVDQKDVMDSEGATPLHHACWGGDLEVVQYLVEEIKCDVDVIDGEGTTPLHRACRGGNLKVVQYLVEEVKCDVDVRDDDNRTPLHRCCDAYWDFVNLDVVRYLVERAHCDINVTDSEGKTPLDLAMKNKDKSFYKTENKKKVFEIIEYLKSQSTEQRSDVVSSQNNTPGPSLVFLCHPKDVRVKLGSRVEFSVEVSKSAKSYHWVFQDEVLSDEAEYSRTTTKCLVIQKCFPQHKGAYRCVATDEHGEEFTSKCATLTTDGEIIGMDESKLLGEILQKAGVSLLVYGIDIEKLAYGKADVTYEDMQYVLKDNPATHLISVKFKEEIKTRLEEERLYKEALANDKKVSLSYTKILALGPGQVGKSTFLYRLLGLMDWNIQTADPSTQPQSSTGITEMRNVCITYTSRIGALTSDSWKVFDESSDLQCQLDGLMFLITEQPPVADSGHVNVTVLPRSQKYRQADYQPTAEPTRGMMNTATTGAVSNTSSDYMYGSRIVPVNPYPPPQPSNIDEVLADFETLQANCKLAPSNTKFHILFNIADIGGQPAFLELLPSLTIGPALYLVFIKLLDGLRTRYPVTFNCKDGRGLKRCKNYTYTSEEVIFTALSSVACFGNSDKEVERFITKKGDEQQASSLALLVGTFKDRVENESDLDKVDAQLQQQLEETDFFTDGLIYSKNILRVNNYNAPKSEIEDHRKLLEKLLKKKFPQYEIPVRWLILSICLKLLARKEDRYQVSFDDCVKLGVRLGMKKEMVKVALQFLHKYVGLIMYFPKNDRLKDVVICDPQIVFTSISEFIFNIYDPSNMFVTEAQHDKFVQTGCFCPDEVRLINRGNISKKILSLDTLVYLLIYLNIIAEVPSELLVAHCEETINCPKKYYFMPAVLQTAELSREMRKVNDEMLPEPLCIRFPTGYIPLGFVCSLSANLIAEKKFNLIPFMEDGQQITYKNMICFRYEGTFDILMMSHSKYCEFQVSRCSEGAMEYWDSKCCPQIREIICEAADRVIQSMTQGSLYKLSKGYQLAFKCPHHPMSDIGQEPLAEFTYEGSTVVSSQCVSLLCKKKSNLSLKMRMWFGKAIPSSPPSVIEEPAVVDDGIEVCAEGTKPLKYQWYRNDKKVNDGEDYTGSTTPKLVIVGTGPQVKGEYKCRVKNKHGELFSKAILYRMSSLEYYKTETGVSDQLLDLKIDEKHFYMLGSNFETLGNLLEELDLCPAQRGDVKRIMQSDGVQAAVASALKQWQMRNPCQATYRNLLLILENMKKRNIAISVCNFVLKERY